MADALEDHEGTVSIGGRTITNLHLADDIDGLSAQEQRPVKLINHLEEASTAYGMLISADKTQFKFKFKVKNTLLSLQRNLPVVPPCNSKQHI